MNISMETSLGFRFQGLGNSGESNRKEHGEQRHFCGLNKWNIPWNHEIHCKIKLKWHGNPKPVNLFWTLGFEGHGGSRTTVFMGPFWDFCGSLGKVAPKA